MAGKTAVKITNETEVTTTELAVVLGLTARRVQQLAQDGTLDSVRRGHFLLAASVQKYHAFMNKEKEGRTQDTEKIKAETDIKKAKAIVATLEAKELQGKMHRSEDVAAMTEQLIYDIRGMIMALPGRLAVDVTTVKTAAEAAEIIKKEIYKIMNALTQYRYDAGRYAESVNERKKWDGVKWDEES